MCVQGGTRLVPGGPNLLKALFVDAYGRIQRDLSGMTEEVGLNNINNTTTTQYIINNI